MFDNLPSLQSGQTASQQNNQNFFQPNQGLGANLSLSNPSVPTPIISRTSLGISSSVYFDQNSSFLSGQNFQIIEALKQDLQYLYSPRIIVNGFASSEGSAQSNQALSESRRNMIIALLGRANTLQALTFGGQGMGETAEETGTQEEIEAARNQNRRVDITILYSPESISQAGGRSLEDVRRRLRERLSTGFMRQVLGTGPPNRDLLVFPPSVPNEPLVPAGRGPETPREGTLLDVARAISEIPAVREGIDNLTNRAERELTSTWNGLSTGGKVGAVSATLAVGASLLAIPQVRGLLDETAIPIPGTPLSITPLFQNRGVIITIDLNKIINP